MSLMIHLYYHGEKDHARQFVHEMVTSGLVEKIRSEEGNEQYDYFFPMEDEQSVLLVDCWKDQEALDRHHRSDMMNEIAKLRKKYKLSMRVERYVNEEKC